MANRERPLSPFMLGQTYRFQITSFMSILHRITGISLALGGISLVWWLMAIAVGGDAYAFASRQWSSPLGMLFLFGFTLALVYHLLNGIRHLLWDAGWGFDIPTAYKTGYAVFVLGAIITGLIWFFALRGAA
ncbi:succinate dehydrogenase, cytochrome b556 subunit [Luteimonas marina]|uniref:Succinate dehydrogenase cytochrome b556 subunit n=1 Tax=Luteimonas marina TaxID=488485 RepID=A0A5C5UC15_9GAMM|nr:succinate dehydrogenase, cytochrome b556 subunit [Luteimonas marina]TWT23120.1 succinate dehydrogenase, cytochrome b556 subunit [Luteimonas marina]